VHTFNFGLRALCRGSNRACYMMILLQSTEQAWTSHIEYDCTTPCFHDSMSLIHNRSKTPSTILWHKIHHVYSMLGHNGNTRPSLTQRRRRRVPGVPAEPTGTDVASIVAQAEASFRSAQFARTYLSAGRCVCVNFWLGGTALFACWAAVNLVVEPLGTQCRLRESDKCD